jgi:hypothetical protein
MKQCNEFCEMSCIQEYTNFVEKCKLSAQLTSSIRNFSKVKIILKNEPQITYINDYAMKFEDFIYNLGGLAEFYFGISVLQLFVILRNLINHIFILFVTKVKLIFIALKN